MVDIRAEDGEVVPIRALVDTGTSSSILLKEFVPKGQLSRYKKGKTTWGTLGGQFQTKRKGMADFRFPELDSSKIVTWSFHIDEKHKPKDVSYDMIIGMDLQVELGLYVDTNEKVIVWDDRTTPLRQRGELTEKAALIETLFHMAMQPPVLKDAEDRQKSILDADYSQVDINDYVDSLEKLDSRNGFDPSLISRLIGLTLSWPRPPPKSVGWL